jgi:hypothetical protein
MDTSWIHTANSHFCLFHRTRKAALCLSCVGVDAPGLVCCTGAPQTALQCPPLPAVHRSANTTLPALCIAILDAIAIGPLFSPT